MNQIRDTRGEPEFVEAPEVPIWLRSELRANAAFVQEAIENGDIAATAVAWTSSSVYSVYAAINTAVEDWIATSWRQNDYDAMCLSRMWRENEQERTSGGSQ